MTVVIGRQNGEGRETIVHVSARTEGKYWDCLEPGVGVVVHEASNEKPLKVFIADTGDELGLESPGAKSLRVGDDIRIGIARNPKNNRLDAFNMELGELPDRDVKLVQGQLRRVIDFVDTGHPALVRMWDKRQRGYRAMGYRIEGRQ